jgi:hypothetical protein
MRHGPRRQQGHSDENHALDCCGIDASVMPRVPRANTNIPTIMLAEKLADGLLS